jgi:hypothetical protein
MGSTPKNGMNNLVAQEHVHTQSLYPTNLPILSKYENKAKWSSLWNKFVTKRFHFRSFIIPTMVMLLQSYSNGQRVRTVAAEQGFYWGGGGFSASWVP